MRIQTDTTRGSPRLYFKYTPKSLLFIAIANTLIAVFMMSVVHHGNRFLFSLIFSQCIGFSITGCVYLVIRFTNPARPALQVGFIAAALIVGAALGISAGSFAISLIAKGVVPPVALEARFKFFTTNLIYSILFGVIIAYIFVSHKRISDEKIKRLEVEKNAVVTEIKLLQSQMEPHFLFNTLSNIISLIDAEPKKARQMLEFFTSFLRESFLTARNETITLSQELEVVKNYLNIFSVRMGDRLRYSVDLPDSLRDFHLPPLLIQPLVENAVKHGLEPAIHGGEIAVQVTREGDSLKITVIDSGMGIREKSAGNGIGLENIKKRLSLLYGGRARMVLEENKPSGVKVGIEIPYETNTSDYSR